MRQHHAVHGYKETPLFCGGRMVDTPDCRCTIGVHGVREDENLGAALRSEIMRLLGEWLPQHEVEGSQFLALALEYSDSELASFH